MTNREQAAARKRAHNARIILNGLQALADGSAWEQGGKNNHCVGDAVEKIVNYYFCKNRQCVGKSKAKGRDFTFQKVNYEVKQNQGNITYIENSQYICYGVIYPEDSILEGFIENSFVVIPTDDFLENSKSILNHVSRNNGTQLYLQVFKNSKKKTAAWLDYLCGFPTIREWYEMQTGKEHAAGWFDKCVGELKEECDRLIAEAAEMGIEL